MSNFINLNVDDIVIKYKAGISEYALAKFYNVDRGTIRNRLISKNISIRNSRDSAIIRHSKMTTEEKLKLTENAHNTLRNKKQSDCLRNKLAISFEKSQCHKGAGENEIYDWIVKRGYNPIPQFAINRFNIDMALFPLAIEIKIGTNPPTKSFDLKKINYITNNGWSILYIFVSHKKFLIEKHADYAISYFEAIRSDPSLIGEYRMIGRDANLRATCRFYCN